MKKALSVILVSLFCFTISYSQSSWQIISSPVNENFVSVYFPDESNGWIVSEDGTLIETSDGGITWTTYYPFPGIHISSIYFSDENHGCMVGWWESSADSSLILVTDDGGNNWAGIEHEQVNRLNNVFFTNNNIGWAVGSYDEWNLNCCLYTSDGGQSWYHQPSMSIIGAELFGVSFRDENLGQICGTDGAFFSTNNGGQSWAMNVSMPVLNLNAIFDYGVLTGCMVGDEGTALFTVNNWYQFIETVTNTSEDLNGVSGDPVTNKLWAVGNNGTIIYSPSYLLGWSAQASGVTENLHDINMLSETNGWAVGDNGTILHYSSMTSKSKLGEQKTEVYPNPVDDVLYVCLKHASTFNQIQMFSSNGKLVYQRKIENHRKLTVDVSGFTSGIYHIKTIGESEIEIHKVLIE